MSRDRFASNRKQDNFFDDFISRKRKIANVEGSTKDEHECFSYFDIDGDGILNHQEFHDLCRQLVTPRDGNDEWMDQDTDHVLQRLVQQDEVNKDQFEFVWNQWIKPILSPPSAFLVVDVQNDFISGSLALKNAEARQDGEEVVPVINGLIDSVEFTKVIFSYDWHPENHISFYKNRHIRNFHSSSPIAVEDAKLFDKVVFIGKNSEPLQQTLWPAHCVQNSTGAKLHKDLHVNENHMKSYKGTNPEQDCYSILDTTQEPNNNTSGPELAKKLKGQGITDLYICGLALDICVSATVLDACRLGFRTILVDDACRGLAEKRITEEKKRMTAAGCVTVTSNEVRNMVSGLDRDPKLARVTVSNIST